MRLDVAKPGRSKLRHYKGKVARLGRRALQQKLLATRQ
jgi:hypothetical protein